MQQISREEPDLGQAGFDQSLKRRTFRSIAWTMAQTAGDQMFSFVVFVLLARLLDKEAIGTFTIAFVFVDLGRNFVVAGVYQRIARSKSLDPSELDTIFWTSLGLAAVYSIVLVACAPLAERVFNAPQLAIVLAFLTVPVLLNAGANTHLALRLREFGHKTLAMRSVLGGLIGGICGIVAAVLGAGIWALVVQRIVRELVCTVLAWTSVAWRPGIAVNLKAAGKFAKEATELGFAQIVGLLSIRTQDIGVARVMGPVALSSYRVAWRCAELIGPQVVGPFATVALQTFSQLMGNRSELRAAYLSMLRRCGFISIPSIVGYAVAGPWLVPALFGPQWRDAGAIAPMLLPLALPYTVNGFALAMLAAAGKITWQRHLSLLDLVSTALVTIFTVRYGLQWLALAYSIRGLLLMPLQMYLVRKSGGIGFADHLAALGRPTIAAALMAAAALWLFRMVDPTSLLLVLPLCGLAALVYGLLLVILEPRFRAEFTRFPAMYRRHG